MADRLKELDGRPGERCGRCGREAKKLLPTAKYKGPAYTQDGVPPKHSTSCQKPRLEKFPGSC